MPPEPHLHVVFALAAAIAAIAAVFDLKTGMVPNWLTYPALLVAPFVHVARLSAGHAGLTEDAMMEGAFAVLGAIVCAIVPIVLWRQGAMGGGDVKLLVAIGALLQTLMGVEAEMYTFFGATLVAPARLAYEGKLLTTLKNTVVLGTNMFLPKEKRRPIDEAALSSFRIGPAVLFGVLLTAWRNW
jgi:prepilin peptidase CpaA